MASRRKQKEIGRRVTGVPCSTLQRCDSDRDFHIEVGSIYEIDHKLLPPRTPVQLRSIRVAMVSEKTDMNVAVRFPSMDSIRSYLNNSSKEICPALDEKFLMGTMLAGRVLLRQVPSHEYSEQKHLESFWLVPNPTLSDVVVKEGICMSELQYGGMVRWGVRRQVKFSGSYEENEESLDDEGKGEEKLPDDEDEEVEIEDEEEDEGDDQEDEDAEDEDDDEVKFRDEFTNAADKNNLKRKRYCFRNLQKAKKKMKVKHENKQKYKSKTAKKKSKNREAAVLRNPKDRWSAERYKSAERNLLEVMRAKGAVANHPILRPQLRAEARKQIGDTGLLDHLLKHMAGKLAPGGKERFRRRHNADGAMEYWLESSDLVNIRKEAGVNDPFWIPPPGWKPGDCPTQDPICAQELKLLKEEMSQLKREHMESKKQFEEENVKMQRELMECRKQWEDHIAKMQRKLEELVSVGMQAENLEIAVSTNSSGVSAKLDQLATSVVSAKSDFEKQPVSMETYNDRFRIIFDNLKTMMEEIEKLTSKFGGKTGSDTAFMVAESVAEKEKKQAPVEQESCKQLQEVVQDLVGIGNEGSAEVGGDQGGSAEVGGDQGKPAQRSTSSAAAAKTAAAAAAAEEKAARRERLKSGFTICKPPGTFLWPDMVGNSSTSDIDKHSIGSNNPNLPSPQVVVQVEDLFVVPTPPSVSSSTALAPPQLPYNKSQETSQNHQQQQQLLPVSPVKPVAERRSAFTVTVSTVSNTNNFSTTTTTTTTMATTNRTSPMINLNDVPAPAVMDVSSVISSSRKAFTTTTHVMRPQFLAGDNIKMAGADDHSSSKVGGASNEVCADRGGISSQRKPSSSSSASSGLSKDAGEWLALTTPASASDGSSHG